jgi:Rrf2 family protein
MFGELRQARAVAETAPVGYLRGGFPYRYDRLRLEGCESACNRMRTISKRTQYGLKAVIALGRRFGKAPVLIATLSTEENIPLKFLEGILLDLKGRSVLESKKGKGGGYQLSRPPSTITIGAIIRLLEGPLAPLPCASETAFKACEECRDIEHCSTRIIMRQVRDAVADVLDKTTLAQLIRQVEAAEQEHKRQPLMYHI